jgi:hypothetical protein
MKMSKFLYASTALAALLAISAPGYAGSVSGEVDVTGQVTGSCSVIAVAGPASSFSGTIALGELAGADGKLIQETGSAGPFTVVCNSSAPRVELSATSLVGELTPPDSTYTNVVGYTAHLAVTETSGTETFNAVSAVSGPTVTSATLAHPLSGAPNNITVSVDTLTSNGGILTAGHYGIANPSGTGGVISITITPV